MTKSNKRGEVFLTRTNYVKFLFLEVVIIISKRIFCIQCMQDIHIKSKLDVIKEFFFKRGDTYFKNIGEKNKQILT